MQIIHSLATFPDHTSFYVLNDCEEAINLARMIEMVNPSCKLKGIVKHLEEAQGEPIVVVSSVWCQWRKNKSDQTLKNVILMHLTGNDGWGLKEHFDFISKQLKIKEGQLFIDETQWLEYLISIGRAKHFKYSFMKNPLQWILFRFDIKLQREGYFFRVLNDETFKKGFEPLGAYVRSWRTLRANKDKIDFVRHRLSNQKSQDCFTGILEVAHYRQSWERFLNNLITTTQYFEYGQIRPDDIVINAGVAGGGEIPIFLSLLGEKGQLHNIDPLGNDYLDSNVEKLIQYSDNVFEHKFALAQTSGTIQLSLAEGQASIKGDQVQNFPALSFDDFIHQQELKKVDVIKMDLEGAEEQIIPTLGKTIKVFRPLLLISIYHQISHLWELPKYLMEQAENYNFYLNVYSWERHEVILYGVPIERDSKLSRRHIILE